jgi:hypothetical protein
LTCGIGKKAQKVPESSKVFCCFADVYGTVCSPSYNWLVGCKQTTVDQLVVVLVQFLVNHSSLSTGPGVTTTYLAMLNTAHWLFLVIQGIGYHV